MAAGSSTARGDRVVATGRCCGRRRSRRRSSCIAARGRRRASSCRSSRRPAVPGMSPVPAFRTTPRTCAGRTPRRSMAADRPSPTRRSGGSRRTSSPDHVTVHVHDGGEAIVPDGRRLYAAETLRMTAPDARSRARRARRARRLSMAGARGGTDGADASRSAPIPARPARRPTSTWPSGSRSTSTASASSSATGTRSSRATWSERGCVPSVAGLAIDVLVHPMAQVPRDAERRSGHEPSMLHAHRDDPVLS